MNKKNLCGMILAVFLMLMMPTISAVEYHAVKENYEEIINPVQSTFEFITNRITLIKQKTIFIVFLYEILQGIFMGGMYILSYNALVSVENSFIGMIIYIILMNLTAFILHKWDESIENNFELTKIQEIISRFGAYIVYFMINTIYGYLLGNDNSIKEHYT